MMMAGDSIRRTGTGRVLAILSLGMMYGIYRHYQQMRALGRGREGFLAQQSHYFDRIAQVHSAPGMLAAGIILAAVTFGLYELISAGFTRVLPPSAAQE